MSRLMCSMCLLVVGCDAQVDLLVEASPYAVDHPDAFLAADVIIGGEAVAEVRLDLAEQTQVLIPDVFRVGGLYAVVAFADLDDDRACTLGEDPGWRFLYEPTFDEDLVWVVQDDVLRDETGCIWFGGAGPSIE